MSWNWVISLGSLVVCSIAVEFARGAMNDSNIAQDGANDDYRTHPGRTIIGSILGPESIAGSDGIAIGPRRIQVFSRPASISERHASMAYVRLSNSSPPTIFGPSLVLG